MSENGHWHTTLGENEGDNFGPTNDKLRVLAAAALWDVNSQITIYTSGGRGQLDKVLPRGLTIAKVMKRELVDRGVPEYVIFEENNSGSTFEQLYFLSEFIKSGKIKGSVFILSNDWHLPRVKAMIQYSPIKNILSGVNYMGAEDVLIQYKTNEWKDFIAKMRTNKSFQLREELEQRGIAQIRLGTYKFTIPSK